MHLPLSVVSKVNEGFVLYGAGELDKDSSLYEVISVANCYYGGDPDLAKVMLLRDIERHYEKSGAYESSFSYKRYEGCRRANEKAGLCKAVAKLVANLTRSEYVRLDFS